MPVLKTQIACLLLIICFSSSCIRRSYYFSPLQGNTNSYHAIPVKSDSAKTATYANGAFSIGGSNDLWRDQVYSFQVGIHEAHVINNIRLYYGLNAALGSYNIKPYGSFNSSQYNSDSLIDAHAGQKTFGSYGVNAGISFAAPMGRSGEWRYFGVEGSFHNEFGDYYNFRKNLPDSVADVIDKKKYIGSLGINTELVFKGRSSRKFGIKFAVGSYLRRVYYNDGYNGSSSHLQSSDLFYFSNTYHFTNNRVTTYFQLNAAPHAGNFRVGMNYRL